jgi:putative toxin-antitoxin system antitoxin component (TIGR02293 family)
MPSSTTSGGAEHIIRSVSALLEAVAQQAGPGFRAFLFTRDVTALSVNRHLTTPLQAVRAARLISLAAEAAAIEQGLSSRTVWGPLWSLGLDGREIAEIVGISEDEMGRKAQADSTLSVVEADRSMRLMRIACEACDAFGDIPRALAWLRSPSQHLSGKTPLKLVATESGTALVRQALVAIARARVA